MLYFNNGADTDFTYYLPPVMTVFNVYPLQAVMPSDFVDPWA